MNDGILIVGARGLLGSSLVRWADAQGLRWRGTSSAPSPGLIPLDLRRDADIDRLEERPRVAFLLAAETNLRRCQDHPEETRRLNVDQTARLARRQHAAGANIVFISTNLVFDGTRAGQMPEDTSAPNTEYGRQKAELEEILVGELARTAVVRLTKVVHPAFPLFRDWLAALTRGEAIRPFSDLPFCPVDLALVTEELGALGQSFRPGVFQLSGDADLSYAEAARLLAETRGFSLALVQPRTTEEAGLTSPFPLHTALAHRPVREGGKAESAADTLRRIFRAL